MATQQNNNNPTNSTAVQLLLDIYKHADKLPIGTTDLCTQLLDILNNNKTVTKTIDEEFSRHQYPQGALTYSKVHHGNNSGVYFRGVSGAATQILCMMIDNLHKSNYVKISACTAIIGTSIGNKKTATNALKELVDKGLIAVKIAAKGNSGAVYMVNPAIATIGKDQQYLQRQFWKLTGTTYKFSSDNDKLIIVDTMSDPHIAFTKLYQEAVYSSGEGKQDTEEGIVRYSVFDLPKENIKAGRQKTPADGAGNTDPQVNN